VSKIVALVLVAVVLIALPGCLYANFTTPLDENLDKTQLGDKVGRSSFTSILWLFSWGDAGTQAAAKQGGLTTINHADREVEIILFFLYYKQTTILYGE
jgi:TRL (tRNA-associated locus)-like protein